MKPGCERIVFHVGEPKSGSSAIQFAFGAQRVRVGQQTLKLLGPPAISHNYLILDLRRRVSGTEQIDPLVQELKNTRPRFAVFSAELASTLPAKRFEDHIFAPLAAESNDYRVLYYVRDHANRVISQFVENIKTGRRFLDFGADLETYFHEVSLQPPSYFPYFERFKKWEARFGQRLVMRPFLREEFHNRDLLHDFVHAGFDLTDGYEITEIPEGENASPSFKDLMVLRLIQEQFVDLAPTERHTLGQAVFELMTANPRPGNEADKPRIPRHLAEAMHQACIEDARQMDTHFFARSPFLVEALEKNVASAQDEVASLDPYDHLSDDEIRYVRLLAVLVREMADGGGRWEDNLLQERLRRIVQG